MALFRWGLDTKLQGFLYLPRISPRGGGIIPDTAIAGGPGEALPPPCKAVAGRRGGEHLYHPAAQSPCTPRAFAWCNVRHIWTRPSTRQCVAPEADPLHLETAPALAPPEWNPQYHSSNARRLPPSSSPPRSRVSRPNTGRQNHSVEPTPRNHRCKAPSTVLPRPPFERVVPSTPQISPR